MTVELPVHIQQCVDELTDCALSEKQKAVAAETSYEEAEHMDHATSLLWAVDRIKTLTPDPLWHPIEQAPKNTEIVGIESWDIYYMEWDKDFKGWVTKDSYFKNPTHFAYKSDLMIPEAAQCVY